jgi:phage baseplate assembly protein W
MSRIDTNVTITKKEKRYSDLAMGFTMSPVTGNLAMVYDEQSVKQAIKTLILTRPGEKFYNKDYGTKVNDMLFDMIDTITAENIKMSIEEAIRNYEPRVETLQVQVTGDDINLQYVINIFFRIINIPEIQTMDIILKRVR